MAKIVFVGVERKKLTEEDRRKIEAELAATEERFGRKKAKDRGARDEGRR